MPTGEVKGKGRPQAIRARSRISGMSLAVKFTLVSAGTFAILMGVFGTFIYQRTSGSLEREIDRYGAGLVNALSCFDISTWELKDRSWLDVKDWLEENYGEYGALLSQKYYLDYVLKKDQAKAAPRQATVPQPVKDRFGKVTRAVNEENNRRLVSMLSFPARSGVQRITAGDVLNVFINRADPNNKNQDKGSVSRAKPASFQAITKEAAYVVTMNGQEIETEVTIREGRDNESRESARLYATPVRDSDNKIIGRAYVVLSESKIQDKLGNLRVLVIVFTFGFIALGAAASFFLVNRMTQPLKWLMEDMEIVASGDLGHRTRAISNDEIGMVARTFDHMTRSMQEAEEAESKHRAIEHDVSLVREIHGKLLPTALPQLEGFDVDFFSHPSEDIGADYYDVIKIDSSRTAIVIAGLPRKGVASAILMALTRTLIRAEAQKSDGRASSILKRVNQTLAEDIRKGMYVTAMLMILEANAKKLTVVNAGHAPMLLHRSKSNTLEAICPDGIALGLDRGPMFDASLKEQEIGLESGDRVVLYTPGLINVKNKNKAPFGEKRFHQLVLKSSPKNSAAFVNIVGSYLEKYREGADDSEDITLLTLKARG